MSLVEGVVGSVSAILKTLECAICLELLKTPVTAGCGHFFCKFCITKVLKSNYRSPCPLCKKPFTRRSIQEAQQRQFVIQAAKALAEACEIFTGVKFFSTESSDTRKKNISFLSSVKKSTTVQGSSTSKKRKSHESETSDPNFEDVTDKANERKSVDSIIEDSNSVLTNAEIIPSTNKRHCQSRAESDEDSPELPSLEDILKSKAPASGKRKSDETGSSKNLSKISPVVLARRLSDSEISSKRSYRKALEEDISVIPDTNVSADIATSNISSRSDTEKLDGDVRALNGNKSGKILKSKDKVQLNNHGAKFKSRLSNKNDKNALANKTNQLNLKKQGVIEKDFEKASINEEQAAENELNAEELVKENKEMDVELFLSPAATVVQKDNTELSSSPGTSRGKKISRKGICRISNKNKKGSGQSTNSSAEEEMLISKLNEAENFSLNISNVTSKTSAIDVNSNEKVCFNLAESSLPPVGNETELSSKPQKELVRLEEITDTAVSVQNVESPEAAKMDLVMKSPGWSKVKQVGKDFRVRKFSRLHVEKNTSSSCPSELDSLSNEPLTDKKLLRTSDPISVDYETRGTASTEKKEMPDSALNAKNKTVKNTVEVKTYSNISPNDEVAVGHGVVDDDCRIIEDVNEVPILVDESEKNVAHPEMSCDDQGNKQPSPLRDGKSVIEACDVLIENVPQSSICKSTVKISDLDIKMGSSAILNNYDADVTNLPGCANLESISQSSTSVVPHVETDASGGIEANSIQTPADKQTNVVNFESEFMEVDAIENVRVNTDDSSHFQNVCVNQNKSNYLQPNYLVASSFAKQVKSNVIDTPKTDKIKETLVKYGAPDVNQGKNIFYAEHAQQTSQRLLDFCENNKQTKTLYPHMSLYPAIVEPNTVLKQNELSIFNPIERFNANVLKPVSTERTKVIKRTCLTLDEIQEAFANSSATGNPENICSLPFLSGDFRLSVCISEETLNISVLRVVNSNSLPSLHNKSKTLLLSEKNIQTSNNNSPVPSPTAILPSSNVESEASQPSQPENQQKGIINMKTTNPFPFLSEYFSDSESTEQVTKEAPLNDSEVFPFVEPCSSGARRHSKLTEDIACENAVEDDVSPIVSEAVYHPEDVLDNLPITQPYKGDIIESDDNRQDEKELFIADDVGKDEASSDKSIICIDINVEKSFESLAVSNTGEKYAKLTKEMNAEPLSMTSNDITADNDTFTEKTSAIKKKVTSRKSLTKGITSQVESKNYSKSQRVVKDTPLPTSSSIKSATSENNSYLDSAKSKSYQQLFDDSEEFSSDPDMAFAMELVAPLKNIAEQMKSTENKEKSKDGLSTMGFSFSLKEKNPMETFEELILSKNKDSFQNSNIIQKPSRLSLKSKRSSKKFKRIRTCDSDDDDSDASESSKNVSMFTTLSKKETAKERIEDKPENTSKCENLKNSSLQPSNKATSPNVGNLKSNDMPYESLQDNSTFNSCISEDMTNNSSDIAMEIEDLDQKILSVVEKLKQCGREDLLNQEKLRQLKCTDKAATKSHNKDEDCQSSFDSEDSTDIFSQSVPPTPPGATSNNNDSGFKASMYGHK